MQFAGTCDVQIVVGKNRNVLVIDWDTTTIENAPKHVFGDRHLQNVSSELDAGASVVDTSGSFKHLGFKDQIISVSVWRDSQV